MTRAPAQHRILLALLLAAVATPAAALQPAGRIRSYLEGVDAGDAPMVAGRTLNEPAILARVYRGREHAPFWIDDGPLAAQVSGMLAAIDDSVGYGFLAQRYHRSAIESLRESDDQASRLALELLLTDAFLSQALHRARGAVYPPNLDADWQVPPAEVDVAALLATTARDRRDVGEVLASLWPVDAEYAQLVRRRAEIVASGDEVTVRVAPGPLLRPGQSNDRVPALKERLMGPGDYSPLYDEDLLRAVKAFQLAAGLDADGVVGDNTLEALNATRVSWIDRIDANLERWRWLPRETPDTYVRVNIAAFTLRAIEHGETTLAMNVIVGKPFRRTPVFTEPIRYLVLNPYWNVPFSIATRDKLPLLKVDATAVAANGFEVKPRGSDVFVPVDTIDWTQVTSRNFDFLLRQRPGEANALGRYKFMLPNANAVYLHDTPSRELFSRQERSFSSGCVRLEQPRRLAEWLLQREHHPDAARLEALVATGDTVTIYLRDPVPAYLVYFTAFVADDGEVTFRRDIYGRDRVLVDALRKAEP